ncbi:MULTISPECIES: hypothetical protein [unclassified Treponema]|uniref:hypothetical protein n=1 Tax=unclassified Treponema TaxID=2638727 RepID=UPI0025CCB86B|nr:MULTISPECIES: hypothetical protein [unclassified Treponema]
MKFYIKNCEKFTRSVSYMQIKSPKPKMMLLTGSKRESTKNFYECDGYNSTYKTAFIQWVE